jgi:peptide-methionine (R)-S-oxide reductase
LRVLRFSPQPVRKAGGLRYCTKSASLRFIGVADLERDGHGQYRALFEAGHDDGSTS